MLLFPRQYQEGGSCLMVCWDFYNYYELFRERNAYFHRINIAFLWYFNLSLSPSFLFCFPFSIPFFLFQVKNKHLGLFFFFPKLKLVDKIRVSLNVLCALSSLTIESQIPWTHFTWIMAILHFLILTSKSRPL